MKAYIYLWSYNGHTHNETFYSLKEAVDNVNHLHNTCINEYDLVFIDCQDAPVRTLSTDINNWNQVRFNRCEVDTSKLLLRKGSGPDAA